MTDYIPIYAQYLKEDNTIETKEIYYKETPTAGAREIGIHVSVNDFGSSIKITYVPSKIKMAASMAREWAEDNNLKVSFATFIFTDNAPKEWWTYQPKQTTYNNGYYESQPLSRYKERGFGIIIRAGNLPWINNTSEKKAFTCELIPF